MTTATITKQPVREIPFLLRVIWFFVLGWEIAAVWILVAWLFNITIIGLPLGLWMINRVPQVLTLKSPGGDYYVNGKTGERHFKSAEQVNFLLRALYFVFVGWWASLLWAAVGWLFCLTIIGLPLGVLMLNWLPFVTTLRVR
ncbi:MAG: YccF domain-containing protein [Anaerolineae bacterium]|nr:YccF domain-containing protein [Anaerolineae bacterium]MCO5203559.1 YccF domain-containing protein [Anaerolineae bacterium]